MSGYTAMSNGNDSDPALFAVADPAGLLESPEWDSSRGCRVGSLWFRVRRREGPLVAAATSVRRRD